MSDGLRRMWDLDEPTPVGASDQAQEFRRAFSDKIAPANQSLQSAAAAARRSDLDTLNTQRERLYTAYQTTLRRIDPTDPARAQRDIDRVLAATDAFRGQADSVSQQAAQQSRQWGDREAEYDQLVDRVTELEEADHPKAPVMRRLVDAIGAQTNDRDYRQSLRTLDQVGPKVDGIYQEHAQGASPSQPSAGATQPSAGATQAAPSPRAAQTARAGQAAPSGQAAPQAPSATARPADDEPVETQASYVGGASVARSATAPTAPSEAPPEYESTATPRGGAQAEGKTPIEQRSPEEQAAAQGRSDEAAPSPTEDAAAAQPSQATQQSIEPHSATHTEAKPPLSQRSPEEQASAQAGPEVAEQGLRTQAGPRGPSAPVDPAPEVETPSQEAAPSASQREADQDAPDVAEQGLRTEEGPAGASKPPLEQRSPEEQAGAWADADATQEDESPSAERPLCEVCQSEDATQPSAEPRDARAVAEGQGEIVALVTVQATQEHVAGAQVRVGEASGTTDASGEVRLMVPAGRAHVTVSAENYHPWSSDVELAANQIATVQARLESSAGGEEGEGQIVALVTDQATQEHVAGAQVRAGEASGTTDAGGEARLMVPAGRVRVSVSAANYRSWTSEQEVSVNEIITVQARLESASSGAPTSSQSAPSSGRQLSQEERERMRADMNEMESDLQQIRSERGSTQSS